MTSTRYRFNPELYNELSSFFFIHLFTFFWRARIFLNWDQRIKISQLMITIFPKLMMTIIMMMMMIITGAFSNKKERKQFRIFSVRFLERIPCDLWISLTFLRRLKRNRLNGKRRKEQRCKDKRNEKLPFLLSCFGHSLHEVLLTMESQVPTSSPGSFRLPNRRRQKRRGTSPASYPGQFPLSEL